MRRVIWCFFAVLILGALISFFFSARVGKGSVERDDALGKRVSAVEEAVKTVPSRTEDAEEEEEIIPTPPSPIPDPAPVPVPEPEPEPEPEPVVFPPCHGHGCEGLPICPEGYQFPWDDDGDGACDRAEADKHDGCLMHCLRVVQKTTDKPKAEIPPKAKKKVAKKKKATGKPSAGDLLEVTRVRVPEGGEGSVEEGSSEDLPRVNISTGGGHSVFSNTVVRVKR